MSAAEKIIDDDITKEEAMNILKVRSWNTMKALAKKHSLSFRTTPRYYFSRQEILSVREKLKRVF